MWSIVGFFTVAIVLFVAGFSFAIYLSYKKNKELERYLNNMNSKLKDVMSEFDFIHCFKELVGIINSEVELNNVVSNISKIIFNALDLEKGEYILFYSLNDNQKCEFVYAYPANDVLFNNKVLFTDEFFIGLSSKTKVLQGEYFFLVLPLYFDGKLSNFFILALLTNQENFDMRLKTIEIRVDELIRFISLGFKTPKFYERAIKDSYTGLYNKMHFNNALRTFAELSQRENIPLSLILLDIDNFKKVNDIYGHQTGDRVIFEIAKILKSGTRNYNLPYRVGGEEFAIILPNCKLDRAVQIAERLRKKVEQLQLFTDNNVRVDTTISLGVSELKGDYNSQDFFKNTDMLLYKAKSSGKNKVEFIAPISQR